MGPDEVGLLHDSRRIALVPIAVSMLPAATTTYGKRDVRAVGLFALLLFGVGIALAALGVLATQGFGPEQVSVVHVWLGAVVFLALGMAMHLKVRELTRNRGREERDTRRGTDGTTP